MCVCVFVAGNTNGVGGNDDELIESLVKTVTATPGTNTRTVQRERKRTKDAHRKSREHERFYRTGRETRGRGTYVAATYLPGSYKSV